MKKRFFLLFVMVGLLVTLASCAASNKYVKLTLSEDYYEVYKGQTLEILPIVNKGSAVGDVTIEYSSYDETIATYVNGNLQGVEYGETIIKVVYAGNATICDVAKVKVVEHDLASEVGVEDTAISFYETDSYQINYTAALEAVYTFESSNEDVATVDANGLVTAALNGAQHNDGKAVITVTASDLYGAVEDQVFTVEVTVKEAHFAITLDLAGGAIAGEYANEYDIHALPHTLPTPTRPGYDFAGWLGEDGVVVYAVPAGSEAALSYTAQWEAKVYNVTYDLDGGALPTGSENPATYEADEEVTLVAPEKVGHTFAGWEANGVKFETFPSDAYEDLAVKALWTANVYTITYVTNGATTNDNETEFTFGVGYTLNDAVKVGYTFLGWYDAAEAGNLVTEIAADKAENVTLYAYWEIVTYKVMFTENGGEYVKNIDYTITSETFELPECSRVGYTFLGWYDNKYFEGDVYEEVVSGTTGIIYLWAKWEANTYNVTYVTNGATTNDNPATFTYDEGLTLTDPVKVGFTFEGWFEDEACATTPITAIAADRTEDVTVYAKWEIVTYTVTFDAAGGVAVAAKDFTIESETFALPATTRTGYAFLGWYVGDEKVEEVVSGTHENLAVVAKWDANDYNVTYVTNGATTNENPAIYEFGTGLTLVDPVKVGFTFLGWYEDEACATTPIAAIAADRAEDVTVYAKWEIVTYTLTYDAAGGVAVAAKDFTIESETFALPATTRTGYAFLGWYVGDEKVEEVVSGTHENLAVVAKWDANDYNVTYVTNGATTNENPAIYEFGTGLTLVDPVKVGFTFLGWYEDEACATTPIAAIAADRAEDVTVYAKWEIVTYTLTYDAAGGVAVAAKDFTIESETFELAATTRTGYAFLGWYIADEKVEEVVSGTHENLVVVAKWQANVHSIEYVLNGGVNAEENPANFAYDKSVTFAEPTKVGHAFAGWYSDEACTTPVTGVALNTDENVKVYAKWTVKQYTITFDTNGGSTIASITQDYASAVTAPADPTKEGHTFTGWDKAIPATMPAEDITIKASWKVNKYTITFDSNGGTTVPGIVLDFGEAVTAPADPTKVGHTFAGWDITVPATMPAENLVIKAVWNVNQYTISFDTNGGSAIAPITQDYASAVTAPAAPTKAFYDFAGWAQTVPATMPAEDITIKATWTPTVYNITYVGVPATGNNTNPLTYTYESETITLVDLVAEHYDFVGWYKDAGLTTKFTEILAGSNGDITVYCSVVATKYEIVYNLPAAGYFYTPGNKVANVTEYEHADEVELEIPTLPGYKFAGWYTNEELTGEPVTKIEVGSFGTQNFYPKWEVRTYAITFVVSPKAGLPTSGEGQMYEIDGVEAPAPIEFNINSPEMNFAPLSAEGYVFVGWFFVDDGALVKLTSNFLPANQHGNIEFYALWKLA